MSVQEPIEMQTMRHRMGAALLNVDVDEVIAVAEAIAERYEIRHKRVPKSGLGMMRLRDSVMAQAFNLGEVPMSTAHVELTDDAGQVYEGGAAILRDHEALAVAIAVCDALLAGGLDHDARVKELVEQGTGRINDEARLRQAMLDRSRVSFSLMNQDAREEGEASHD